MKSFFPEVRPEPINVGNVEDQPRPLGRGVAVFRLRVRAVDVGDMSLQCLPKQTIGHDTEDSVGSPVGSTTVRPVRKALVEMGSSVYAVGAPRCARRESPGIVLRRFPLFPSN